MAESDRIRWRCRRGMLELDMVLGRFLDRHYSTLDDAQKIAFESLLDMPDVELWDMIAGMRPSPCASRAVLDLLKTA